VLGTAVPATASDGAPSNVTLRSMVERGPNGTLTTASPAHGTPEATVPPPEGRVASLHQWDREAQVRRIPVGGDGSGRASARSPTGPRDNQPGSGAIPLWTGSVSTAEAGCFQANVWVRARVGSSGAGRSDLTRSGSTHRDQTRTRGIGERGGTQVMGAAWQGS